MTVRDAPDPDIPSKRVTVRTIGASEWPTWRDLRMRALAESPDAFRMTFEEERSLPDRWWADIVAGTVESPRGGLWVAREDGEAVGMLFGRIDEDDGRLRVGSMWVAPGSRRSAIGTELIRACLDWGRGLGAEVAALWVTEDNGGAISFYERHGFSATGETQQLRSGSPLTVRELRTAL